MLNKDTRFMLMFLVLSDHNQNRQHDKQKKWNSQIFP